MIAQAPGPRVAITTWRIFDESRGVVAARWALLSGLFAAPLAFGAVQPWAWGALGVTVAAAIALYAAGTLQQSRTGLRLSPLCLPLVGMWVLGLLQYMLRGTVDSIATREALVKSGIYLSVAVVGGVLFAASSSAGWNRFGAAVALYTFALSLFAILQFFVSPNKIYGAVVPREGGAIFGPYVNHDNYAGLVELLFPIAAAYALTRKPGTAPRRCAAFACLLALASTALSGSRAGAASLAVEAVLFAIVLLSKADSAARTKLAVWAVVVGAVTIAISGWLIPSAVSSRYHDVLNDKASSAFRVSLSADTLRMALDHRVAGVGLGAFETAYPSYQSSAAEYAVDFAHNDAAQWLAETGVTGGILALIALAILARSAKRTLYAPNKSVVTSYQLAAVVGIIGVLIHSFFDFNLHIPANAAWFALCAALATAKQPTMAGHRGNWTRKGIA